jgi:hypothetical protein
LKTDLENIWKGLIKPEELKDTPITDFFDFQFTSLPHKLLKPEDFDEQTLFLSERFYDSANANYLFGEAYNRNIPADGFPLYAKGIWVLFF